MSLPTMTGTARLIDSPELRFTSSGKAVTSLLIDSIGPSLRSATAKVTKASGGGSDQGREQFQQARQAQGAAEDPWVTSGPASSGGSGWGGQGGYAEEAPPF